ncbi:hypothetical protein HKX48_003272 [Thoreauomyces humboldtii]|nr:hypothetical protein HKX48_003272 [Thoreauomyces humboldtii]
MPIFDESSYQLFADGSAVAIRTVIRSNVTYQPSYVTLSLSADGRTCFIEEDEPPSLQPEDASIGTRRHVTATVSRLLREPVAGLLAFRNTFATSSYFPATLLSEDQWKETLLTNHEFSSVRWPGPFAFAQDLASSEPRRGATDPIVALDGYVSLVLAWHRRSFTVRFPVAVSEVDLLDGKEKVFVNGFKHVFVFLEKSFSLNDFPECWKYPLDLAMFQAGENISITVPAQTGHADPPYVRISLPNRRDDKHADIYRAYGTPLEGKPVRVLSSQKSLYRVHIKGEAGSPLVECFADGIVLSATQEFRVLSARLRSLEAEVGFVDEAYPWHREPPPTIRNAATGHAYPIAEYMGEMTSLLLSASHTKSTMQTEITPIPTPSSVRTTTIPGLGTFTAYPSGRTHAHFDDGATAELLPDDTVHILHLNGENTRVRSVNPVGNERYVRPLVRFARLGLLSSELREPEQEDPMHRKAVEILARSRAYLARSGR